MRFKTLTAAAALLLYTASLWSQNPCGYKGKSPWLDWYQRNRDLLVQDRGGSDSTWLYVPITLHIVGATLPSNLETLTAIRAVCRMNEQYQPARIRFFLMPNEPFVYHYNSSWNNHQYEAGAEMITDNNLPGRLNAYLVSDPAGNCGYAWLDAIVLGRNCSGADNTTWSHEAGHHLSLPHPFYGWEDFIWDYSQPAPPMIDGFEVEKTDGSNCYFSGDGFCDTKPDYLSGYRWTCNENKESPTLQIDPDGVPFRSDGSLYMGYSTNPCRARFTEEQMEAMRFNIQTEHVEYLQTEPSQVNLAPDASVHLLSPIDTATVQYNNVTLEWDPVPNATFYVVEVALQPGFVPLLFNKTLVNETKVSVNKALANNRLLYWRVRAYNEWDICQDDQIVQRGVFKTQNLLATNDLERTLSSDLSPNPVVPGQPAVLTLSPEESMDALLTLTDAAGRQCYSQMLRLAPGENQLEIPTDALHAGLYIVTLQNEKGAILKRLAVSE